MQIRKEKEKRQVAVFGEEHQKNLYSMMMLFFSRLPTVGTKTKRKVGVEGRRVDLASSLLPFFQKLFFVKLGS